MVYGIKQRGKGDKGYKLEDIHHTKRLTENNKETQEKNYAMTTAKRSFLQCPKTKIL